MKIAGLIVSLLMPSVALDSSPDDMYPDDHSDIKKKRTLPFPYQNHPGQDKMKKGWARTNDPCVPTRGPCVKTFAELRNLVSTTDGNDIIALCCGSEKPIVTESAVVMDKPNITLCCHGSPKCVLQSSGMDRNLYVTGENFTARDIVFRDGKTSGKGGNLAIEAPGDHRIIDCEFHNGVADEYGGNLAADIMVGSIALETSFFINGHGSRGGGGVAIWNAAEVSLDQCIFMGNSGGVGGGLFTTAVGGHNGQVIKIQKSQFLDNKANRGGGFLATSFGKMPSLSILGCEFNNNEADENGGVGAVFHHLGGLDLKLENNTGAGNVVNSDGDNDCDDFFVYFENTPHCIGVTEAFPCNPTTGSCISTFTHLQDVVSTSTSNDVIALCGNDVPILTESAIVMDKRNMTLCCLGEQQCIMQSSGMDRNLHVTGDAFTVRGIIFRDGKTSGNGGNVFIEARGDHRIIDCEFHNGVADEYGGNLAANVYSGDVAFEGSAFFNGHGFLGGGGAAVLYAKEVTTDQCIFEGNSGGDGGGLYSDIRDMDGHDIKFLKTKFSDNKASDRGGGFHVFGLSYPYWTFSSLSVLGCEFTNNEAFTGAGGAVSISAMDVDLTFDNNGGAGNVANSEDDDACDGFLVETSCRGITEDSSAPCIPTTGPCISTFTELQEVASTAAGNDVIALCGNDVPISTESAIVVDKPNMTLCCVGEQKCIMQSSGVDRNLYVVGEDFSARDVIFRDGKTTGDGGNVVIDAPGDHHIISCEFHHGIADEYGGNLAFGNASRITLEKSLFFDGNGRTGGGGVAVLSAGSYIYGCSFERNVGGNGGGVFTTGYLDLYNTKFVDNKASYGGGFFAMEGATVIGCEFNGNEATAADGDGDAGVATRSVTLRSNRGEGTIAYSSFDDNTTQYISVVDNLPW